MVAVQTPNADSARVLLGGEAVIPSPTTVPQGNGSCRRDGVGNCETSSSPERTLVCHGCERKENDSGDDFLLDAGFPKRGAHP